MRWNILLLLLLLIIIIIIIIIIRIDLYENEKSFEV